MYTATRSKLFLLVALSSSPCWVVISRKITTISCRFSPSIVCLKAKELPPPAIPACFPVAFLMLVAILFIQPGACKVVYRGVCWRLARPKIGENECVCVCVRPEKLSREHNNLSITQIASLPSVSPPFSVLRNVHPTPVLPKMPCHACSIYTKTKVDKRNTSSIPLVLGIRLAR